MVRISRQGGKNIYEVINRKCHYYCCIYSQRCWRTLAGHTSVPETSEFIPLSFIFSPRLCVFVLWWAQTQSSVSELMEKKGAINPQDIELKRNFESLPTPTEQEGEHRLREVTWFSQGQRVGQRLGSFPFTTIPRIRSICLVCNTYFINVTLGNELMNECGNGIPGTSTQNPQFPCSCTLQPFLLDCGFLSGSLLIEGMVLRASEGQQKVRQFTLGVK